MPAQLAAAVRISEPSKRGQIHVRGRTGDIEVLGVEGGASLTGDVYVVGKTATTSVSTASGDIEIRDAHGRVEVNTASGDVGIDGGKVDVRVETVSGDLSLTRAKVVRLVANTVVGDFDVAATLERGPHTLTAHSGDIEVQLDKEAAVQLVAETHSGAIVDRLGPAERTRNSGRYVREYGKGGPRLEVSTFDGVILFGRR